MTGVFWGADQLPPPARALFFDGNIMEIGGEITSYNGKLQLKAHATGPTPSNVNRADFEKASKYGAQDMFTKFMEHVVSFENDDIRGLAGAIVGDYSQQFAEKPAATGMHHAFKHGLLEHTLQMLETAESLFKLPFYAEALNKDLCMFGIMFHDFGKIFEYGDAPDFKRTVSGIKVPHIPKMAAVIYHEGIELKVPEPILDELMSIVLSHHRFMKWGSPCPPSSPEALFVHYIDNLHGDVFGVIQKIEGDTTSEDRVKYGFGDESYTIIKKRFSTLLEEHYGSTSDVDETSGKETSVDGF